MATRMPATLMVRNKPWAYYTTVVLRQENFACEARKCHQTHEGPHDFPGVCTYDADGAT